MLKTLIFFSVLGLALAGKLQQSRSSSYGDFFFAALKNEKSRIIGGDEAEPHGHPHQVSLQVKTLLTSTHICGGSIITPDYVLCAAHCVKGQIKSTLKVIAGAHNLIYPVDEWQKRKVEHFVYHEDYDSKDIKNDISLIKVDIPFEFNERVAPIALPRPNYDPPAGIFCQNTGWGKINNLPIGSLPNKLQIVELPIVSRVDCIASYVDINPVSDGEVCAGKDEGGPCNGDSGGPLVCEGVLAGIVSWGMVPCGQAEYPGVYTNVGAYIDWINANMDTNMTKYY